MLTILKREGGQQETEGGKEERTKDKIEARDLQDELTSLTISKDLET